MSRYKRFLLLCSLAWFLSRASGNAQTVTIPVVVHVIWHSPEENISEEQILSQIDALNRDFQSLNDQSIVPPGFRSLVANTGISFCLAARDPEGKATTGIVRRQTSIPQIASASSGGLRSICYTELGGSDAWNPDHYLNIWVGSFGGLWVGEASPPLSEIPAEDGIRIDPRYFGTLGTATAPYNLGHSLTHETGHYLGLLHPWGTDNDNINCEGDDGVADTPRQSKSYYGECPQGGFTCGTPDMTMNFMNWSDDACVAMFTKGQKNKMWETLNGSRKSLLQSENLCSATALPPPPAQTPLITVYPNPGRQVFTLQMKKEATEELQLFDASGRLILRLSPKTRQFDLSGHPAGIYYLKAGKQVLKIACLPD